MVDRDEGRLRQPIRYDNPAESLLRLQVFEQARIHPFAGAGADYDVFEPHNPGVNTIYSHPLLYATPSVRLALFFALVVNNPDVRANPELKTVTCEHPRNGEYDFNIYVAAEEKVIDMVDTPTNSGWVAVFRSEDMQGVRRYAVEGREGEYATHLSAAPSFLVKVTNKDFPMPIREIPVYSPLPNWTSQQRRKHTPYETEGFPCFNRPKPFAIVFPIPQTRRLVSGSADY